MKKLLFLFFLIFSLLLSTINSYAGFFSKEVSKESTDLEYKTSNKLISKRQDEARKLISEGNKLIKKGNKQNNKKLIVKGQIKKEIGQKQLKLLKEEAEDKESPLENTRDE